MQSLKYYKVKVGGVSPSIDGFHSIFSLWQLEGITSPCRLLIASHDFFCSPVSMGTDAMESIYSDTKPQYDTTVNVFPVQ